MDDKQFKELGEEANKSFASLSASLKGDDRKNLLVMAQYTRELGIRFNNAVYDINLMGDFANSKGLLEELKEYLSKPHESLKATDKPN